MFDGEPRDGGHCLEAPDHGLALGEQHVAEFLHDEGAKWMSSIAARVELPVVHRRSVCCVASV